MARRYREVTNTLPSELLPFHYLCVFLTVTTSDSDLQCKLKSTSLSRQASSKSLCRLQAPQTLFTNEEPFWQLKKSAISFEHN